MVGVLRMAMIAANVCAQKLIRVTAIIFGMPLNGVWAQLLLKSGAVVILLPAPLKPAALETAVPLMTDVETRLTAAPVQVLLNVVMASVKTMKNQFGNAVLLGFATTLVVIVQAAVPLAHTRPVLAEMYGGMILATTEKQSMMTAVPNLNLVAMALVIPLRDQIGLVL